MLKILKHLKPYWKWIIVVFILLVVLVSKNKNNGKKLDNTMPVEELVIKPFDTSDNNN